MPGVCLAYTIGLCVLIPACGAYAIYDEPTRQKVVMYTNAAKADIIRCMVRFMCATVVRIL